MRRKALGRWLPVVAWATAIFVLSSFSGLDSGLGTWDLVLRKAAHIAEYAVLAVLATRALARSVPGFLLATVYAATDELHQHFVPGRNGTLTDVAIDAVGAALGAFAYRRWAAARA